MKKSILLIAILASIFGGLWSLQATVYPVNERQTLPFVPELDVHLNAHTTSFTDSALKLTLTPGNTYFQESVLDTQFFLAEIKACDWVVSPERERVPLNLCLVIDRSGSMSGSSINYVKNAAKFVINNLRETDFLSVVVYDHQVELMMAPTRVKDKKMMLSIIDEISTRGSTNLCGGLMEGYKQLKNHYKQGFVNRVLLLSDGLVNSGITDRNVINQHALQANLNHGITTSTFGVGIQFDEDLMLSIAESGAGNYYYIANPSQIPEIFEKELNGLLSVVAQNTYLIIQLPPGLKLLHIYGYENRSTVPNTIEILWRDISANESKSLVVSYLTEQNASNKLQIKAELKYDDAIVKQKNRSKTKQIEIAKTNSAVVYKENVNTHVQTQYAVSHSNYLLQQAMKRVDEGDMEGANVLIKSNNAILNRYQGSAQGDELFEKQKTHVQSYERVTENYSNYSSDEKKSIQKMNKEANYKLGKRKN